MKTTTVREIANLIADRKKILIYCHINPDADTLGSAFALKHAVGDNAEIHIVCDDNVQKRLFFLTGQNFDSSRGNIVNFVPDLLISVDAAEKTMLGKYGDVPDGFFDVKIDHHPGGGNYAKYNYTDPTAAATGEIVYKIIRELEKLGKGNLNRDAATALYGAIISDTGCFRYANTTSETLRIAACLIDEGAENFLACTELFEKKSAAEVMARRLVLNNIRTYFSGRTAIITISNDMKTENGISDDDLGGTANFLREMDGVNLAISIIQNTVDAEKFKISMRSNAPVYANKICAVLGGGGHDRAAGAILHSTSSAEAEKKIVETVRDFFCRED